MANYYCENCEFLEDRSTDKLIDGYCKKYNCPLNFYDWWEKCDKCIIDTLKAENAALKEGLERALEIAAHDSFDYAPEDAIEQAEKELAGAENESLKKNQKGGDNK